MIHSPYPGVGSRNVKLIIEICGCVKDEKSAIIHCTMHCSALEVVDQFVRYYINVAN